jgi:hypothetical protein
MRVSIMLIFKRWNLMSRSEQMHNFSTSLQIVSHFPRMFPSCTWITMRFGASRPGGGGERGC